MKHCRLINRLVPPVALGSAFAVSNGITTGLFLGLSLALATLVWK